jgi:uncharacterized repeat protein (TIGR02543 family)
LSDLLSFVRGCGSGIQINFAEGSGSDYTITFSKDKNKIGTGAWVSPSTVYSGSGYATTGLGNQIGFDYSSFANPTTVWQLIKSGGYFTNTDKISGMKSITLTKTNTSTSLQIFWSETKTFDSAKSATYDTTSATTFTCDFAGYSPNYIKVVALGTGTAAITSGSIAFSCLNSYPTLTLTADHPTMGSVTGGGIHKVGSSTTIVAAPNTGYKFIGWYNGSALLSTEASYTFAMPECVNNYDIEGRFIPNSYNVVLSSEDESKGTVSGSGTYDFGSTVSISAVVNNGYTFAGWYSGTTLVSSNNPYSFRMPASSLNYVAKFSTNNYTLAITADSTKGSATGAGTYAYKASVNVTATPKAGYSFSGWYNGETLVSSATPYSFTMPCNDLSYEARFTINNYVVSLSSTEVATTPVGTCEVSGAGTYVFGSSATISATPASGYGFLGWYDGTTLISSDNPYTFTMASKDVSYTARYSKKYHVSVTSKDETKGIVSGAGDFAYTSNVIVTGTPVQANLFNTITWYDDSLNSVSNDFTYTFAMPESDMNLSADFRKVLGNSFNLGKYPQTVVEDFATLNALASATDTDSDGYLEYGSDEYKKVTGSPRNTGYKSASGNVTFASGTTYYFKVEPIQWRVLSGKGTATGLVMAEKILDKSAYYTSTTNRTISGSTVYANNYQYSTLRAMLNGLDGSSYSVANFAGKGFLGVAFTEAEKAYIATTTVDNSAATTESSSNSYACANTSDKIFALSYQDLINTSYGFDSSYSNSDAARRGVLTDYARATGAWMSTSSSYYGNGYWWSRSPTRELLRLRVGRQLRRLPLQRLRRQQRVHWRPSELHREHRLSGARQSIRRREPIRALAPRAPDQFGR